ncbi:oxygenase MpaB family protein [Parasphingorhabdus pacifica]
MKRFARLEQILSLDPDRDYEQIYRMLAEHEFPWDIARALELALFRTYAVPSIGKLLDRTGEFTGCPQQRYDDTALVLYEIFHSGGIDEAKRAAAVDHLNRIHGLYKISNADYLYTLATFVVIPVRWLELYGWRSLHEREIRAITNTMRRMGEGMHIGGIPETYAGFERLLDEYERDHFDFDPGAQRVAHATLKTMGSWFPYPLSEVARRVPLLLMDEHLLRALHLPEPPEWMRAVARLGLKARGKVVRYMSPRPDSAPAVPAPRSYPDGYVLEQLGPRKFHKLREGPAERDGSPVS